MIKNEFYQRRSIRVYQRFKCCAESVQNCHLYHFLIILDLKKSAQTSIVVDNFKYFLHIVIPYFYWGGLDGLFAYVAKK